MDRVRARCSIVLLTWLAWVVRFCQLEAQSLWFDEAFSWLCATIPLPQALQFALTNFVHPPLYYLLLRPVMWLGDGAFQLRLLSAWIGVLSVPLLYTLGRRMAGRAVGVLAAALLALNPFHVWYSQEARMYTLLFLLALGVGYFFQQVLSRGRRHNWVGLGIVSGLAYVTHYFALLLPLAQFIYILLHLRRYQRLLRRWVLVQALAAFPLGVWVYCLYRLPEQAMGIGWIPRPVAWDPLLTLWSFSLGFPARFGLAVWLGLLPFAGALVQAACLRRRREWWWLWLALPPLFVLLLSWGTGRSFYVDRFFIICLPAYLLLVAWGVVHLPRPWLRRAVAIVLLAASLAGLARLYTDPALLKADWRGALGYVDEHAIASDRVLLRQLERVVLLRFYDCELPWAILGSSPTYRDWTASTASGGRSWLLYRHPGESAHTPTKPWPFDIYSEADAATVAWLTTHREAVVEHHSLAGIELLLLEVEP